LGVNARAGDGKKVRTRESESGPMRQNSEKTSTVVAHLLREEQRPALCRAINLTRRIGLSLVRLQHERQAPVVAQPRTIMRQ
jgi:hypothetical protein